MPTADKQTSPVRAKYDVGAVMAKGHKSYFPMMLGNGIDNVLIGYSGAMGACQAHEFWNYGNMHAETVTGWYRSDIRRRPALDVLNLMQCGYIVRRGIHADGIEMAEQRFDAVTGILKTHCYLGYAELDVTTFLTRDHILVHRFAVASRGEDMALQFFVRSALPSPLAVAVTPDAGPGDLHPRPSMEFAIEGDGWPCTPGRIICDHPGARRVACYNREAGIEAPLSGQTQFTFAVQCALERDVRGGAAPEKLCDCFDYTDVLRRHCAEWEQYNACSKINIPRDDFNDIYNTSLYVIRSHQHPVLGGITVGSYPGMWRNTVYPTDMSFSIMGLLGANRMCEAERGIRLWKRALPNLAKRLRDAGLPHGAACPPDMSLSGEVSPLAREKILEQKHIETVSLSLQAWQLYLYSGRLAILKDYWDVLIQPLEFVLGSCVEEFEDHAEIIRSSGPNGKERVDGKSVYLPNPTITLLTTIEALRGACKAADLLGRELDPRWRLLLPKLERGLEANRFDGLLREARSPRANVTGSASYAGLFDVHLDENTLRAQIKNSAGRKGFLTWINHGYCAVPWKMCDVSAACSRMGLEGAAQYLEMAAQFTTTLNGFPEAIRPDGAYMKTWYPTVHGDFVHAVNLLLLRRRGDVVELFPGVPEEWGDVSFDSLRIPVGLLVSASRTGQGVAAQVTNDSDRSQQFNVCAVGKAAWTKPGALDPGQTAAVCDKFFELKL